MLRSLVGGISVVAFALTAAACTSEKEAEGEEKASFASILGWEDDPGAWEDEQRAIEEAVADCMRAEGWEYIPVEDTGSVIEYSDEDERERLEREGFGITYYTLNSDSGVFEEEAWVDPNSDYVESLSESEAEAYYSSLWGSEEEIAATETLEVDPETGEEYYVPDGFGAGCQGEAYEAIQGDDPGQSDDAWEAFEAYFEELDERVQADSRVQEAEQGWAQCIQDAGFEYETQDQLWEDGWNDIQTRHDEILGDSAFVDPLEGMTDAEIDAFFESATDEELEAMWGEPVELTDAQRTQLEALLDDEVALAVADFECSNALWEQLEDTYAELEEQFILEHEDELNALAAELGLSDEP